MILSGGLDDGSAGLYTIKARGGFAIVQDPAEALMPDMPRNALDLVAVDCCLPIRRIANLLVDLTNDKTSDGTESGKGDGNVQSQVDGDSPTSEPPGLRTRFASASDWAIISS